MRVRFLTCFIAVLCTQAISILGFSSEHRALNSSNTSIQTKQPTSKYYGSIKEGIKLHREDKKYIKEEKFERAYDSIKKARGKGANGGANDNRSEPRRSRSSAQSISMLSWISTVCVSFVLTFHAKLL